MRYLLDSDAFSDLVRGHEHVMTRFSLTDSSLIRISTVTVKEVEYGRRRHPDQVTRRGARTGPHCSHGQHQGILACPGSSDR